MKAALVSRGKTPILETLRLRLRPLEFADHAWVQQHFPKWEIVQYLSGRVPWPYPDDGVETYYRDILFPAIERGNWHCWVLTDKASGERLGITDLMLDEHPENRGFWMLPRYHGNGYMLEAVCAVNDFAFDVLGMESLYVGNAVANAPSSAIQRAQGSKIEKIEDSEFVNGRILPAEYWRLTADDWRASPLKNGILRRAKNERELSAIHDLRRRVLFEAKGRTSYNTQHADDLNPQNHFMGFWRSGQLVGTLRLDPMGDGQVAVRLVAVEPTLQRGGHGRAMMAAAHDMIRDVFHGDRAVLNAAMDAVPFYEKLSYTPQAWADTANPIDGAEQKQMVKVLA